VWQTVDAIVSGLVEGTITVSYLRSLQKKCTTSSLFADFLAQFVKTRDENYIRRSSLDSHVILSRLERKDHHVSFSLTPSDLILSPSSANKNTTWCKRGIYYLRWCTTKWSSLTGYIIYMTCHQSRHTPAKTPTIVVQPSWSAKIISHQPKLVVRVVWVYLSGTGRRALPVWKSQKLYRIAGAGPKEAVAAVSNGIHGQPRVGKSHAMRKKLVKSFARA
jgi:hypothetical protein